MSVVAVSLKKQKSRAGVCAVFFKQKTAYEIRPRDWSSDVCSSDLLFPQFVPDGAPVLPWALAMAGLVVAFDIVWYSVIAYLVARARRAFVEGPWLRRAERLTGAVLVA